MALGVDSSTAHEVNLRFTPGLLTANAVFELGVPPYEFHFTFGVRGLDNTAGVIDQFEAAAFSPITASMPFRVGEITFQAGAIGEATIEGFFGTDQAVLDGNSDPIPNVVFNPVSVNVIPAPPPTPTATPTATPSATPTAGSTPEPTPTATPGPGALTKAEQACVNEMNKNGERVNRAQLKENERCLRNFQNERLATATFDDCTTADDRGKVQRAENKTADREAKKCGPLAEPPAFGYTGAIIVNTAGVNGALSLLHTLFGGPPVSDTDLFTKADNNDTAKCQFELLKRTNKLENTVLKEVNKAKRQALRDETVDSQAALEAKLLVVLSSNRKISRTQDQLVSGIDRKCASLLAPPGTIFPGTCGAGNPSLSEVEDCAIAAARCEACLKINAFDDLDLDCDQADDQNNGNGSCS